MKEVNLEKRIRSRKSGMGFLKRTVNEFRSAKRYEKN